MISQVRSFDPSLTKSRRLDVLIFPAASSLCWRRFLTSSLIGWIIFRAETITQAWDYICGVFTQNLLCGPYLINREYYIEAWKKGVELFGVGNVGSGIIIGLDDINSSLEGIKKMIEVGVLPSIIPFKPTPGSVLENHVNCVSDELYTVTDAAAKLMREKGLDPTGKYGCIGCGACTLEGDLYRYYKNFKEN